MINGAVSCSPRVAVYKERGLTGGKGTATAMSMPRNVMASTSSYTMNQYWKNWPAEAVAVPDMVHEMAQNTRDATARYRICTHSTHEYTPGQALDLALGLMPGFSLPTTSTEPLVPDACAD